MSGLELMDLDENGDELELIDTTRTKSGKHGSDSGKRVAGKKKGQKRKKKKNPLKGLATALFLLLALLGATGTFYYRTLYYRSASEAVSRMEAYENEAMVKASNLALELDQKTSEAYQLGLTEGIEKATAEQKDLIKQQVKTTAQQDGLVKAIRELFPENVVYYDTQGYVFAEINPYMKPNVVDNSLLVYDEKGRADYLVDGVKKSKRGIDVSKYNTKVDWNKVSSDDISFIFARAGFRGYGSGDIIDDDTFEGHVKGARQAGIDVGVYFFTQAVNAKEGREEAEYVLDRIKGMNITYPIAIDVEKVNNSSARAENISMEDRTQAVIAFCERIKEAGYTPMVYGNVKCFMSMLDMTQLEEYEKWFAYYDTEMYFPYEVRCWQYSEKGKISGIKGDVDLNIWFE